MRSNNAIFVRFGSPPLPAALLSTLVAANYRAPRSTETTTAQMIRVLEAVTEDLDPMNRQYETSEERVDTRIHGIRGVLEDLDPERDASEMAATLERQEGLMRRMEAMRATMEGAGMDTRAFAAEMVLVGTRTRRLERTVASMERVYGKLLAELGKLGW